MRKHGEREVVELAKAERGHQT
eukprot:SAG31_NODE_2666_length_5273_cov_2.404716_1_plen_21_part_10